jgi:diketogulonate reductase-like aldo/keto reductase
MNIPTQTIKDQLSVPVIGKGTWMTSLRKKQHYTNIDESPIIGEIKNAIDNGITYIDTAERYANGYSEMLIGKAIKKIDRNKLFLVSKVSASHLHYDDVITSVKASLKRLNAKYLDLYLIHQFNPKIPLKETMRAMDYLIEQKLVKNIGVCNFTIEQMKEAQSYTKNKIAANQLHYNYMFREAEKNGIIAYCQKNDILIIAWRPYQQELLTEKSKNLLDGIATKYKKTPLQIATLWLMAQPNTVVLSRFNKQFQIKEVADALGVKIDTKDIALLSKEN